MRLHDVQISERLCLCLVTSLTTEGAELADLSQHRYDVEIDILNFKVALGAETTRVKSVEMFEKELWISVTSDNLVCQFCRAAAKQARLPEHRLSFKRVLTTFETFLLRKLFTTPGE